MESKYKFSIQYSSNIQTAIKLLKDFGRFDDTMLNVLDMHLKTNREGLSVDLAKITGCKPVNKKRFAFSQSELQRPDPFVDKAINSMIIDAGMIPG